ncbi:hypothetical protein MACJ_000697 [Theileria orientalis]|uniref:Uncharacterized protein n=1 Tax=Theileria orientalis TaxID=68886 RepID=A0A976QUS9_THEOR|nr:hypothetical protein MACJ_000697 [Theileria orientalis]
MNTSLKGNFLTFISFKLSRKGKGIVKKLFKFQIWENSAVVSPLAPRTPLYELFCKRAHCKRSRVSKLTRCIVVLKRRSKKKETQFQVLKSVDLNRLFGESETTSKVRPRKLFSKTPRVKSFSLRLKSKKSEINNKENAVISDDSDIERPLGLVASCFPAAVLFHRKARGLKGSVSKLKRKLIALKRRSKKKETQFQVLKSGDLNRLFGESETTSKVRPRKLFSKTPRVKSFSLRLKSKKSEINNKENAVISDDSDIERPLGLVASCFPAAVLFHRKARGLKGSVSKLKRKFIALKRRSKKKETQFQVLKSVDLNRLFGESETTSKVRPRKLFSKTPRVKSFSLRLKSKKSEINNKENAVISDDSDIEKPSKRKYNTLRKYFSRMKEKWTLKVQKFNSPTVTFDESLYYEYKDVIKLLELFQGHVLPRINLSSAYAEIMAELAVEEPEEQVYELSELEEGVENANDHLEIVEIDETAFEPIEESEIEQDNSLDVLFEGNLDLKLQFFHEEELTETFVNNPSGENFITARFGSCELESPRENEKPQGEEQPEKEPLYQPQYLQEPLQESQSLDEPAEDQTVEYYPQEERLEQQQPLPELAAEEHTEESPKLELRLEDLQLQPKRPLEEKEYSSPDYFKLGGEELSILSELADVISTDESVSRALHDDDESSCSTITFRKEDWSWYYEQQETPIQSQVLQEPLGETVDESQLQDELLDETVDESQLQDELLDEQPLDESQLQDELLDETVDESHLQDEPKESEPLEDYSDDDSGPHLPLNLDKVHKTMGLLDQYALRRDHAQTTRAHIDVMNAREGHCSWYYIKTTYEQRYNTAHLQRTGHLGVLPASKTILEEDYVDGLLKDIMFKTFIVRTMLSNARTDLLNLSEASFITSSPALKCHISPLGLEELLYKIGYNWDMTKSRFHQLMDLVAHANELARVAEDIPDHIYDSLNRVNNFMVTMKNEYDIVMETMRVTKTCVLFDLNNECRASRGETGQQGRGVTRGCNHQGPLGANGYHRKAHESMFEHFCHVNSMLTALQRTVALRKRRSTRVKSAPK